MLWYSKSLIGRFTTLLRGYGSAFPRSIPPSLVSAALTWLLHTYAAAWIRGQWDSQVLVLILSHTLPTRPTGILPSLCLYPRRRHRLSHQLRLSAVQHSTLADAADHRIAYRRLRPGTAQ